jgi:hypothetical protein
MPTQVKQLGPDQHESGTFALVVTGPAAAGLADPSACQLAVLMPGSAESFLHPNDAQDPWKPAEHFMWPKSARREGGAVWLEIDHGVTFHLKGNTSYRLKLRSGDGPERSDGFLVPATIRRPSSRPTGWVPPGDPKAPAAPAAFEPVSVGGGATAGAGAGAGAGEAAGGAAAVGGAASGGTAKDPVGPSGTGRRNKWLVPAIAGAVLLVGGGVAFMLLGGGASGASPTLTMDSCRQAIVAAPDAVKAREQAEGLAKDRKLLDCQLLLFKYAAEKGDAVAARRLGGFYDPDTWSKETSPLPAPNPLEAARWHKSAAESGDAESLYRYGMLLKLGRTDEADGPEKSNAYLKRAEAAGHPLAKAALGQ